MTNLSSSKATGTKFNCRPEMLAGGKRGICVDGRRCQRYWTDGAAALCTAYPWGVMLKNYAVVVYRHEYDFIRNLTPIRLGFVSKSIFFYLLRCANPAWDGNSEPVGLTNPKLETGQSLKLWDKARAFLWACVEPTEFATAPLLIWKKHSECLAAEKRILLSAIFFDAYFPPLRLVRS